MSNKKESNLDPLSPHPKIGKNLHRSALQQLAEELGRLVGKFLGDVEQTCGSKPPDASGDTRKRRSAPKQHLS